MPFARNRKLRRAILLAFALAFNGCAPLQPPSATGPKGNEPVYPVLFKEDIHRRDAVITAINKLLPQPGGSPTKDFELQPITATIERLPSSAGSLLYLPKLGAAAVIERKKKRGNRCGDSSKSPGNLSVQTRETIAGRTTGSTGWIGTRKLRTASLSLSYPRKLRQATDSIYYRPPDRQHHEQLYPGCRPHPNCACCGGHTPQSRRCNKAASRERHHVHGSKEIR